MRKLSLLVSILGLSIGAYAQDVNNYDSHTIQVTIPEVALLDIEGPSGVKNFGVTFTAPTEAGNALGNPSNNTDLWLNWSSIITETGSDQTRAIKVKLSAVVPGVDIKVVPGTITGGQGTKGTIVSAGVTLTTTDQDLVTAIGSCYTESGTSKGSNLTYSFTPIAASYGLLVTSTPTVTVTYTLTDN